MPFWFLLLFFFFYCLTLSVLLCLAQRNASHAFPPLSSGFLTFFSLLASESSHHFCWLISFGEVNISSFWLPECELGFVSDYIRHPSSPLSPLLIRKFGPPLHSGNISSGRFALFSPHERWIADVYLPSSSQAIRPADGM